MAAPAMTLVDKLPIEGKRTLIRVDFNSSSQFTPASDGIFTYLNNPIVAFKTRRRGSA